MHGKLTEVDGSSRRRTKVNEGEVKVLQMHKYLTKADGGSCGRTEC